MRIKQNGNVGIGTITPAQKLDVAGNINISDGSSYMYNGAPIITASPALDNYFFGNAGNLTMTDGANTATGYHALHSETSGYNNTAMGVFSLRDSTTGKNNTAIGVYALANNISGDLNTSIGVTSLYSNTEGAVNTAIGYSALHGITTGTGNLGIGDGAGQKIADGVTENHTSGDSVYIGNSSMALADGDSAEIVIGSNAIGAGSNSVVIGSGSNLKTILNGNVGIGTTSPLSKLNVSGTTGINWAISDNSYGLVTIGTQGTSGGSLFVNTPSLNDYYASGLSIDGEHTGALSTVRISALGVKYANQKSNLAFFTTKDATLNEAMRIDENGNVGIGTTNPSQKLSVVGNAQFTSVTSGTYAYDLNLTSDGTLTTSASDINLKTNLKLLSTSTLDKVLQLKPYNFNWKTDPNGKTDVGLIAQDVENIFPEITFTNSVDGYKGINYSRLPVFLVSAIQELNNKIVSTESYISNGVATLTEMIVDKITANKADIKEVKTEKICIGETCIDEQTLKNILQENSITTIIKDGGQTGGEDSTSTATSTAENIATSTATTTDGISIQATSTENVLKEISTSIDTQSDADQMIDKNTGPSQAVHDSEII